MEDKVTVDLSKIKSKFKSEIRKGKAQARKIEAGTEKDCFERLIRKYGTAIDDDTKFSV